MSIQTCLSDDRFTFDYILFGVMVHQAIIWAPNVSLERKFVIVVAVSTLQGLASDLKGLDDLCCHGDHWFRALGSMVALCERFWHLA